jgi:vacuolar protein sorting-associated protein VTA1
LINSAQPRLATVEDVSDDGGIPHAPTSRYSLNAAAPVSAPNSPLPPTAPVPDQVSPIAPPDVPSQEPGSYFPSDPSAADQSPLDLPSTTSMPPPGSSSHNPLGPPPVIPDPSSHDPTMPPSVPFASSGGPSSPQHFYQPPPQHPTAPTPPFINTPQHHYTPSQVPPAAHNYHTPRAQPPPPAQQHGGNNGPAGSYNVDDMAMVQAQKHAKWAISALNFEDVPTAVRELQAALATLGAR